MEHKDILLKEIIEKLQQIEQKLEGRKPEIAVSEDWIPREKVMEFFNYGDTQIAAFQKSGKVVIAKVGKRIFFNRKSITKAIEDGRLN
jgi:hypothetical protein